MAIEMASSINLVDEQDDDSQGHNIKRQTLLRMAMNLR